MFQSPSHPRWEPRQHAYPAHARSHQPPASKAIPITSQPIAIPNAKGYTASAARGQQDLNDTKVEPANTRRSARTSFSVSSESSFGSASHYYSTPAPPQETRPRLAALGTAPSARHFGSSEAPSSWAFREPPPHQAPSSNSSRPAVHRLHTSPNPPPSSYRQPSQSTSLPDLRNIRPHAPDVVAARRRLEDNSTKPFSLDPPPFTDHDVPLPRPYNAAYPHPLTAYASPGVNSYSIHAVGWRETLEHMMETDIDLVKGTILAASDRDINPPALMIPVFEGEGCGIPERLWSRFESMGEGLSTALASAAAPSSSIPPRFAQAGMQVVSTPGGRAGPPLDAIPADNFPAVRTNFSNVLRRTSEVDGGRAAVPARRPAPQPTPFHKTELCRTWEHEGVCKYGSNCQFAHGRLELRMPVTGMPTPPSSHTGLPSRYDDSIPTARPTSDRRASLHPLSFVGEHASPLLRSLPRRQSTPSPIGAERLASAAPWKTVPVPTSTYPSSADPLFSFAEYPYSSDMPQYGTSLGQKPSLPSLSASAASFQSTSTPSTGGYSYSTSPKSFFLSIYPQADFMPSPGIWADQHTSTLIVEAADDADVPDWEMLKRSIDATTVRSVWEE